MNKYQKLEALLSNGKIVCAKIKTGLPFPRPITERSEMSQSVSLDESGKCRLFGSDLAGKRTRTKTVHADAEVIGALIRELHEYFVTPHDTPQRGLEWKVILIDEREKKHNFKGRVSSDAAWLNKFSARVREVTGLKDIALFDAKMK